MSFRRHFVRKFTRDRLTGLLKDSDPARRWAAVAALSGRPITRNNRDAIAQILIPVLNDSNSDVLGEARRALIQPTRKFLGRYFVRQGFRDGRRGLVLAMLLAVYELCTEFYLWDCDREAKPCG